MLYFVNFWTLLRIGLWIEIFGYGWTWTDF